MSGPLGSSQWMYSSGGFYPYEIEQSLRFNDDDSAYLSRTPASAGNRKTWTWSGWVKRGNLGSNIQFFGSYNGVSSNYTLLGLGSNNSFYWQFFDGVTNSVWQTTAVLRDASAWYHLVGVFDTTQATDTERAKLYVNGVRLTSGAFVVGGWPALNLDTFVNSTQQHYLGRVDGSVYFDGYLAEVNFIDGQALAPTSFGEFKSGIWVPKAYTGTYGTNGFYLPFSDSAAIGDDLSGNANDWTPSGLVATDVLLDSPTNNYAVLNPLDRTQTDNTFSDGNLRVVTGTTGFGYAKASIEFPATGKWYAEFTLEAAGTEAQVGIVATVGTNEYVYRSVGSIFNGGTSLQTGLATYTISDLIGVAYDADAGELQFYKNNVAVGTAVSIPVGDWMFVVKDGNTAASVTWLANFGQSAFSYTPPADFLPLNTANLPAPAIDPAQDDVPADYFNTVLYTGTGAAQSITGVGFQPDWTWLKSRSSGAQGHRLVDGVRGAPLTLKSHSTDAEFNDTTALTAFAADGFDLGTLTDVNGSGSTYVAWNWLAGNGTASNTDGTITSTVSVNQKAGFSVVKYSSGVATGTVGHGLGAAPKMVIVKILNSSNTWAIWHSAFTDDEWIFFTTTAKGTASGGWNNALPTPTVFSVGNAAIGNTITTTGGFDYIAYCFAEVEGYSKFGSYTGNASADGPFVWCGFRPAFVMMKQASGAGTSWSMFDAERTPSNVAILSLNANVADSEYSTLGAVDLVSNGFKIRNIDTNVNASGGTYIFMAFAEIPVKYSGTMAR